MKSIREEIVAMGRVMFERRLTDMAGGNISARDGEDMVITPRYAGHRYHWQLDPEDLLAGPILSDELTSDPCFSREGLSHLAVYRAYDAVQAIVHAHPFYVQPFVALEKPIQAMVYYADKYGTIPYIDHVPHYSQEQADNIVAHLRGKESLMEKAAAVLLMPRHGIFVAAGTLHAALDAVERINTSAWCMIAAKLIA